VLGGEAVRSYPVRVQGDQIYIDVRPLPASKRVPALFSSLEDAFEENDWGHAGRTVVRLLECGVEPAQILGRGCEWAALHAPYGFDHGLAVAADLGALLDEDAFAETPEVLLLEALSLMVEPNLRRPQRQLPEPGLARPDLGAELRRLVEAEELESAESLLRGALARGADPGRVFRWITHAATDHFLDFGHAHIYCVKAEELIDIIGWERADPIVVSLLTRIVNGTREDTLPYMKRYRREVESITPELAGWAERDGGSGVELGFEPFSRRVLDGKLGDALGAVTDALGRGVDPDRVALALGVCAAERLMRFDATLEMNDEISEGWLAVTHSLTHADAVRETLRRRLDAESLRGLLHSARFVNHLAPLDAPPERRGDRNAPAPSIDEMVEGVVDDLLALPIFVDHHIKTVLAARRLGRGLAADIELGQGDQRELPRLATARFLAGPHRQRRIRRNALVSRRFVSTGKLQKQLLGY
jgi:hypothetical protein